MKCKFETVEIKEIGQDYLLQKELFHLRILQKNAMSVVIHSSLQSENAGVREVIFFMIVRFYNEITLSLFYCHIKKTMNCVSQFQRKN